VKFSESLVEKFFVMPDKNENFKCPRCQHNKYYDSVDGFVEHSNAYGASWKGEDIVNKRCVKCDAVMDRYVNTDYLNFVKRWKTVGIIASIPFIIWATNKFMDYLLA
jgi:hypothetical protein